MPEPGRARTAVVAALEREVRPLVKAWHAEERRHEGRSFQFYKSEGDDVVLVCGGIGAQAARRAAEAVIALYSPAKIYSVGFAGALDPALNIADIIQPEVVVDAKDGSRTQIPGGKGTLVTFSAVANPTQKAKLRDSYAAHLVDMEAAAVARAAQLCGVEFRAGKAISDEADFAFPAMERFVTADGQFQQTKFALYAALRPWLWPKIAHIARNSSRASAALYKSLEEILGR